MLLLRVFECQQFSLPAAETCAFLLNNMAASLFLFFCCCILCALAKEMAELIKEAQAEYEG